jgi:hypothetical protein
MKHLAYVFAKWLWEFAMGEDPECVRGHLRTCERLNGIHCAFLEDLERLARGRNDTTLKAMIDQCQKDRTRVC